PVLGRAGRAARRPSYGAAWLALSDSTPRALIARLFVSQDVANLADLWGQFARWAKTPACAAFRRELGVKAPQGRTNLRDLLGVSDAPSPGGAEAPLVWEGGRPAVFANGALVAPGSPLAGATREQIEAATGLEYDLLEGLVDLGGGDDPVVRKAYGTRTVTPVGVEGKRAERPLWRNKTALLGKVAPLVDRVLRLWAHRHGVGAGTWLIGGTTERPWGAASLLLTLYAAITMDGASSRCGISPALGLSQDSLRSSLRSFCENGGWNLLAQSFPGLSPPEVRAAGEALLRSTGQVPYLDPRVVHGLCEAWASTGSAAWGRPGGAVSIVLVDRSGFVIPSSAGGYVCSGAPPGAPSRTVVVYLHPPTFLPSPEGHGPAYRHCSLVFLEKPGQTAQTMFPQGG
ncbi:unnamed protein product, partial [marine sediment metagenome]